MHGLAAGPGYDADMTQHELGLSINDVECAARDALDAEAFGYLQGGADDERTLSRNHTAFADVQIRARRLVDAVG